MKKVLYRSPQTDYTVLKVQPAPGTAASKPRGTAAGQQSEGDLPRRGAKPKATTVTVTGPLTDIVEGQQCHFWGDWMQHHTYGRQLAVTRFIDPHPQPLNGLISELASRLPGVGAVTAKRMCDQIGGNNIRRVLNGEGPEGQPNWRDTSAGGGWRQRRYQAILDCGGIGPTTATSICAAWDGSEVTRDAEGLLTLHGFSRTHAAQVVRLVGEGVDDVRQQLEGDPYLTLHCSTTTFKAADQMAHRLGVPPGLPSRGAAAITAELTSAMQRDGHCYMQWGQLQQAVTAMLLKSGRPWPLDGECSLQQVAQDMHQRQLIVAESGDHFPIHQKWCFLQHPPNVKTPQGFPVTQSSLRLNKHLIQNVNGVGEHALKQLYKHFRSAEGIIQALDSPQAPKLLRNCERVGPVTAMRIHKSWLQHRPLLPHMLAADAAETDAEAGPGSGNRVTGDGVDSALASSLHAAEESSALQWSEATRCYTPQMYKAETVVASSLARLASQARKAIPRDGDHDGASRVERWMKKNEAHTKVQLSEGQREAVRQAANAPVMVLTGGPGCGKTFATATIVKLWRAMSTRKARISLCAPTGRAAERLANIARLPATTIHRLLMVRGQKNFDKEDRSTQTQLGGLDGSGPLFGHNAHKPLLSDAVLVDEASMLDLPLMAALLDAIPSKSSFQLVLVGDADQLQPVGPGSVLQAIINSGRVPLIDLREIFRQDEGSAIVRSAHEVNSGIVPSALLRVAPRQLQMDGQEKHNAQWVEVPESQGAEGVEEAAMDAVVQLKAAGWNVARDLQVLTPMKAGHAGTRSLNHRLQSLLNPASPSKPQLVRRAAEPSSVFRLDDRVIQVVNDHDRDVFNGDQGHVVEIAPDKSYLKVAFKSATAGQVTPTGSLQSGSGSVVAAGAPAMRVVQYSARQVEMLELAWVTTVHKAQGGESPAVLMCLAPTHRRLLSRRLFYTGLTRARKLAVVVATPAALKSAVKSAADSTRACSVQERFEQAANAKNVAARRPLRFPALVEPSTDIRI